MKRKKLEILLERLDDLKEPDVDSEQYATPATVASELLYFAFMNGDLEGQQVYDLGCGSGILGIGAKVLGARAVIGIDSDEKAIEIARLNARKLGVEVEFRQGDVQNVEGMGDTVVMNPPFGAQRRNRHADRVFVAKALEIAPVVYSILNTGSELFVRSILPSAAIHCFSVAFPLQRHFWFHTKDKKCISVDICRIKR